MFNHFRKPYKKRLGKFSEFKVWLVDGEWVRKNINEDFVNFDQHYHIKDIPEKELWIDAETDSEEYLPYISHLILENRLMKKGMNYNMAFKKAFQIEKRERTKILGLKNKITKKEVLERIHFKNLNIKNSKVAIWSVNGKNVRNLVLKEYREGGHDKIYEFIPKNEIWLEKSMPPRERKFIMIHELHERRLMAKGWTYKQAHRSATYLEDYFRKNPKKIEKYISKEVKINNKFT